ncbi:MAG: DUF1844 domain-containing protein [Deltaproteobacteria bacterium]|nr:DUF1844 domain-containing protein [Deltaproteobacteria bacterium]
MPEEKKEKSFVFVDKRKVTEREDSEPKAGTKPPTVSAEGSTDPQAAPGPSAETQEERGREEPLPEIDFNSFILSLSSSAMMHLGLLANPVTEKTEENLPLAKQTIDIISMLRKKTEGNLRDEESKFLEAILYDLRMNFVKISRRKD